MDSGRRDRRLIVRSPCCWYGDPLSCPVCDRSFQVLSGFIGHAVEDHWWEPQDALEYWKAA